MNVYTLPGANALKVAHEVRALMAQMSHKFPPGTRSTPRCWTPRPSSSDSIHGVYQALIEAGILVLLVIMLFLQNFRAMLVPATTVPVTIIGAFAAMALLGFTVNLMTLFALILAIGIVVDDAIVIVENASHYIEQGLTPKDAAIKAMERADRTGAGNHAGADFGLPAGVVSAGNHRPDVPAVRPGDRRHRGHQRAQRADAQTDAVRAVSAPRPQGPGKNQLVLPAASIAAMARSRTLYRRRQPDGATIRGSMACVFLRGGRDRRLYLRTPSDGVSADRGPGLLPGRCRATAGRVAAAGARAGAANRCGSQARPRGQGMGDERRLLGDLDSANLSNVVTEYVMYQDWDKRPAGLSQDKIVADLRDRFGLPAARFSVLIPPPIPGLGEAGGFQMMIEDRTGAGIKRA